MRRALAAAAAIAAVGGGVFYYAVDVAPRLSGIVRAPLKIQGCLPTAGATGNTAVTVARAGNATTGGPWGGPAATNLLFWSENIVHQGTGVNQWVCDWTNNGTRCERGYEAPNGTLTASRVTRAGTPANSFGQTINATAAPYTFSIWLKAGTTARAYFGLYQGGWPAWSASIVSGPGTLSGTSGGPGGLPYVDSLSTTQWTLVRVTSTLTAATALPTVYPETTSAGTAGVTIFAWGAQVAQADNFYAYAKTDGASASTVFAGPNLAVRSEEMDQWANSTGQTPFPNVVTAPDGSLTADIVGRVTGGGRFLWQAFTAPGQTTWSFWIKAVNDTSADFNFFAGAFPAWTATIISGPGNLSAPSGAGGTLASIQNLSTTQWTRVSVTATLTASAAYNLYFYPQTAGAGTTQAQSVATWGHMVEGSASAGQYVRTGPTAGPPTLSTCTDNQLPIGPAGAEVYAAGTNTLLQSETSCVANAAQAPWTTSVAPTCVTNTSLAPDGTATADRWTATGVGSLLFQTATTASAQTFTASGWFSKQTPGYSTLFAQCSAANNATACSCGRSDGGTITANMNGVNCECRSFYGSNWTRAWATVTCTSATTAPLWYISPGDYNVATGSIDVWGAQVETGSYPTPYIPTTTLAVTRNATDASVPTPAGMHLTNKWCIAATMTKPALPAVGLFPQTWAIGTGNANSANLGFNLAVGRLDFQLFDSTPTVKQVLWTYGSGIQPGVPVRLVACNDAGTLSLYADGRPVGAQSGAGTGLWTATQGALKLGNQTSGATQYLDGSIRDVLICPNDANPLHCQ